MKIPGYIVTDLLLVTIFTTFMVLCITLPISPTNDSTLGESIFGLIENLPGKKRRVKKESDWKNYYGSCSELKEDIERLGRQNFSRTILSLHKTAGKTNFEETRQLFLHGVLTESLDTGGPAYYNSNILSRYFRKDYYDGD